MKFKNDEYYVKTTKTKKTEPSTNNVQAESNSNLSGSIIDFGHGTTKVEHPIRNHSNENVKKIIPEPEVKKETKAPEFNINNIDLDNIISHIKDTGEKRDHSVPTKSSNNNDPLNFIEYVNSSKPEPKQETYSASPLVNAKTGPTQCVA